MRWIPLLDRYLLQELGLFSLCAFGLTTGIVFLDKFLLFMMFILQHHLDLQTSWYLLVYTLPTLAGLTLPIAFCLGCTLTFHRLAGDGEYLAWQAAGVSVYRMLAPLLLLAGVAYLGSCLTLSYVTPWGFVGLRHLFRDLAPAQLLSRLHAGVFVEILPGIVIYCEEIDPQVGKLQGVFLADTRAALPQIMTAQHGTIMRTAEHLSGMIRLQDGTIHVTTQAQYNVIRFGQYDIPLDLQPLLATLQTTAVKPRELLPAQLRTEIRQRAARGEDTRALRLHWHKLFALPFACFIFVGLGPVLGVEHPRATRPGGYLIGGAGIFVYYLFLAASDALGESTLLPPLLVAWLPNVCMGMLTLWLLRRTARGQMLLPASRRWLTRRASRRSGSAFSGEGPALRPPGQRSAGI